MKKTGLLIKKLPPLQVKIYSTAWQKQTNILTKNDSIMSKNLNRICANKKYYVLNIFDSGLLQRRSLYASGSDSQNNGFRCWRSTEENKQLSIYVQSGQRGSHTNTKGGVILGISRKFNFKFKYILSHIKTWSVKQILRIFQSYADGLHYLNASRHFNSSAHPDAFWGVQFLIERFKTKTYNFNLFDEWTTTYLFASSLF